MAVGRNSKYNSKIQRKADDYFKKSWNDKVKVPYIEELALICEVDDTTIVAWAERKNKSGKAKYPSFLTTYRRIKTLQKLRLLEGGVRGVLHPATTQFQLTVNHGMVKTEKHELTGENGKPLYSNLSDDQLDARINAQLQQIGVVKTTGGKAATLE